jgi:hypothetical protein
MALDESDAQRMRFILETFPALKRTHFDPKSSPDVMYNCFAWAADEKEKNHIWSPVPTIGKRYWPENVAEEATLEAFIGAYGTRGYAKCENGALEEGVEKIAIYAGKDGPLHAARQLRSGYWTSKLGTLDDIEHELEGLSDGATMYGSVVCFLSRARATTT